MEDDLTKNGRRPKKNKKIKDDLKKEKRKKGRRPKKKKNGRQLQKKIETNQSSKINLIGCDTIVNSPS